MEPQEAIRDGGIALVFLGVLVLIVSVAWVVLCEAGNVGPCIGTPFQGRQGFLELLGSVLLVVGLVLMAFGRPATVDRPPSVPMKE